MKIEDIDEWKIAALIEGDIETAKYEIMKLVDVAKAVKSMKAEALKYDNWYTFVTCEYAERIDETLRELEK